MSPPMSQECWDHNRRLYREMTESSTPRDHQDEVPLPPTQRTGPIRNPRPGAQSLNCLPSPILPTHAVHRIAQSPFDRRPPYPDSRMRRQAARTTRPTATPTTYPIHPSTASTLATHPNMPGLNLTTSNPQIFYHIRTSNSAHTYQKPRPAHITQQIPSLTPPANAPLLLQMLTLATPAVSTVKFSCGCLNRGTCIHYQICFRRDRLPDGLICPACRHRNALQETISARRKCPQHTDDSGTETRHVASRPEDFLPSEEQRQGYEGMMRRTVGGMDERSLETLARGPEREGLAKAVPPRRASRGMAATASQRAIPSPRRKPGHAPETPMRRASIKPLRDIRPISTEPTLLPPPAWPTSSPLPAAVVPQAANQTFFRRVSGSNSQPPAQSFNPTITSPPARISTSAAPTPQALEQAHSEALAEDAERTLRAENRRMGIPTQDDSDDEGQGTLYANLRTFETGVAYDPESTLDYVFRNSGGLSSEGGREGGSEVSCETELRLEAGG